jgi:hypothetical protein
MSTTTISHQVTTPTTRLFVPTPALLVSQLGTITEAKGITALTSM